MENKYKVPAVLFIIDGVLTALSILLFIGMVVFFVGLTFDLEAEEVLILFLIGLTTLFALLKVIVGAYLLKQREGVHKFALPLAVLSLLSFPLGTISGALYLYQRFRRQ
ncbi:hypothetical protein EDC56_0942 [Sinobacterium caligoides]|uniref:Uncharacterized protein n=1 Tax=Sinobacterium caligoides TaxID=933926 RepID=A0A3N2E0H0_9GAMM|nr:hypothetical protein [Sinobacterium caligoides]ROS05412.1 hypothetical protein EDC56_0942 [Sinobacterium caligoides]